MVFRSSKPAVVSAALKHKRVLVEFVVKIIDGLNSPIKDKGGEGRGAHGDA